MIGRKAEIVLNRAVRYAVEREHEYFTLEHVLWSLLANSEMREMIEACGGDSAKLRLELESYLQSAAPKIIHEKEERPFQPGAKPPTETKTESLSPEKQPSTQEPSESHAPLKHEPEKEPAKEEDPDDLELNSENIDGHMDGHPVATIGIQRLIQRALFQVQNDGKDEIQPEDLFLALFHAKDSQALLLLSDQGIQRKEVLQWIRMGSVTPDSETQESEPTGPAPETGEEKTSSLKSTGGPTPRSHTGSSVLDDPLTQFSTHLNEQASQGLLDPLIGRELELDRIVQTLCRRQKNNPLLVGEPGVGKTALAEGLASRIVAGEVPEPLKAAVVYSIDLSALLAGAKFRGDFEQRFKRVISALKKKTEKGQKPILFIDEIHSIVGAGAVSGGALDAASMLKPLLSRGDIRCLGSTTYHEYRTILEKDQGLIRRFQKIDVLEPTLDEATQILLGLQPKFEKHHGIQYTPEAIRAAVELAAKHIPERFLPDKAIDILDEAGAKARLKQEPGTPAILDHQLIEETVAQIARIPARSVSWSQKLRLKDLKSDLQLSIFGQDQAIDALVTSIRLARSGLRTGERPVGTFLFCGATGVGKTELSKQLAHGLGVPFLRFDMSEYGEKHSLSRLIGAPPGYVGFEQAGLLSDSVAKHPYSVILLDEIEKSHADIWNLLLQVMDYGVLTDNTGRKINFRNTILILTSNVGSRDLERPRLGIVSEQEQHWQNSQSQKAVEQTFSPEFRNRLDAVVYFNPLGSQTIRQVVDKQLMELETQLLAKQVEIEIDSEVRAELARRGFDRKMGARPLGRVIQDLIKKPLAEEILFGRLEQGGQVQLRLKDNTIVFEFSPVKGDSTFPGIPPRVSPRTSKSNEVEWPAIRKELI